MITLTDDIRKRLERAIERRWGQSLSIDILPTAMGNWMVCDRENGARLLVSTRRNRVRVITEYAPREW
jgi:hypothetical protein